MSTLIEQFDHSLTEFGSRVALVAPEHWGRPTPCPGWDVQGLVAHVIGQCRAAPYLLAGGSPTDVGDRITADTSGAHLLAAWEAAAAAARQAFAVDGALDHTVVVTSRPQSARDYIWSLTVDLTVHAWDLARGIESDERLEPELVRRIHAEMVKDVDALMAGGRFDPPVPVPAHADLQARMLGLVGRRV